MQSLQKVLALHGPEPSLALLVTPRLCCCDALKNSREVCRMSSLSFQQSFKGWIMYLTQLWPHWKVGWWNHEFFRAFQSWLCPSVRAAGLVYKVLLEGGRCARVCVFGILVQIPWPSLMPLCTCPGLLCTFVVAHEHRCFEEVFFSWDAVSTTLFLGRFWTGTELWTIRKPGL